MHDAALSTTCKSCVLPATSQQAQRSSSGTLSQGLVIHTRRYRRSYKIGVSNALALSASKARKQRRMCWARGLPSWKTSKLLLVAKRVPTCQRWNLNQQVTSPVLRSGTLTSSSHASTVRTAWKVLMSFSFTIKRQNLLSLKSPFEVEQWGLMEDCLIQIWVHLWTAYAQVAPDLCNKAEEYAKITYSICIGEDDTFDEKYGKLAIKSCSRV